MNTLNAFLAVVGIILATLVATTGQQIGSI